MACLFASLISHMFIVQTSPITYHKWMTLILNIRLWESSENISQGNERNLSPSFKYHIYFTYDIEKVCTMSYTLSIGSFGNRKKKEDICIINDPLGQTHSPTSCSDHYFHATFVLFRDILKSGDGRTDENNDHYWTRLWVGRVDQKIYVSSERKRNGTAAFLFRFSVFRRL